MDRLLWVTAEPGDSDAYVEAEIIATHADGGLRVATLHGERNVTLEQKLRDERGETERLRNDVRRIRKERDRLRMIGPAAAACAEKPPELVVRNSYS